MAQLKHVVDPFGEVNVLPGSAGRQRVVATILMKPQREGTQTGIALDGSGSMRKLYGMEASRPLSPIFASARPSSVNEITPVAQKICAYLARNLDADGGTTCIYWAVGPAGSQIEEVGDFTAEQAEKHTFGPPRDLGTGTQLLPALRYFLDRFRSAPWGFYVFITDGELHDLEEVMAFSKELAREIAAKKRNPVKLVLIGVGPDVAEHQMQALDDLDTGTDIDLWDHKLASEMRVLEEIFAEVVDRNARIADKGRILDPDGKVVRDYSDVGVPAFLEFEMPAGAKYFTLQVAGASIHQPLVEGFQPPPSTLPAPSPSPAKAAPASGNRPSRSEVIDALPAGEKSDDSSSEWRELPLEFEKNSEGTDGMDLEKSD